MQKAGECISYNYTYYIYFVSSLHVYLTLLVCLVS